jgi:two-component system chemotaxis response regulator CheB
MKVKKNGEELVVQLDNSPPQNSCRPSVDVLFESVEQVYRGGVVAAILTGMGQDGLRGTELLKRSGACVVAQDEPSSVVWGMPGAVAKKGLADMILPLQDIVPGILKEFDRRALRTARASK